MKHPRVLVAEDELIVGWDLCDTMQEAGFETVGPCTDISSAMVALQTEKPDLAILDVQLADGEVHPLADLLMKENIPVIFHSGHFAPDDMVDRYPNASALSKPCPPATVIETAQQALSA